MRYDVERGLLASKHAVHFWKKKGFIQVRAVDKNECEGCTTDLSEYWYRSDMVGYSIRLPLDHDSVRNLQAASDVDPARVVDILQASENRSVGLFQEIGPKLPTRKVQEKALCKACTAKQSLQAWVEEICQLIDIVRALEECILADKRIYEQRWRSITIKPSSLIRLPFSDIPWPVQGSRNHTITSPDQITKSAVRRFLFSRCVYEKYAFMVGKHPRDLMMDYRRRWDPKWFRRHLPRGLNINIKGFRHATKQWEAILEGVSRIQRIFTELEEDNWEVILGDQPSEAQWELSPKFPMRVRLTDSEEVYTPIKWTRHGKAATRIDYATIGFYAAAGFLSGYLA